MAEAGPDFIKDAPCWATVGELCPESGEEIASSAMGSAPMLVEVASNLT